MTRAPLYRRAVFAAVSLIAALACSVADPIAPASVFSPDAASPDRTAQLHPTLVPCSATHALAASAVVGPQGGVLRFGASRLVVPAGALRSNVRITATPRGGPGGTIDFRPEGLRFQRPVTLVLSAASCSIPTAGVPEIVYVGVHGRILETIGATYDRRWNEVVGPIVHFSGYAIAF